MVEGLVSHSNRALKSEFRPRVPNSEAPCFPPDPAGFPTGLGDFTTSWTPGHTKELSLRGEPRITRSPGQQQFYLNFYPPSCSLFKLQHLELKSQACFKGPRARLWESRREIGRVGLKADPLAFPAQPAFLHLQLRD